MNELQGLRTFGLTDSLPEVVECARQYALTLYGVKKKAKSQPCSRLHELRCILASTTDKYQTAIDKDNSPIQYPTINKGYTATMSNGSHPSKQGQES